MLVITKNNKTKRQKRGPVRLKIEEIFLIRFLKHWGRLRLFLSLYKISVSYDCGLKLIYKHINPFNNYHKLWQETSSLTNLSNTVMY